MTDPKEEAKRIINMFHHSAFGDGWFPYLKRCAILHVDGLIKLDNLWLEDYGAKEPSEWIAVRQELEKM